MSTLAAALAATGALVLPAGASATPTCTYDATTATVSLALDAPAPKGAYTLVRYVNTIGWLNGRPASGAAFTACPGATVTNTDTIDVTGTVDADDLIVSLENRFPLSPGGFAPGLTPETDGISEIEITIDLDAPSSIDTVEIWGTPRADVVTGGLDRFSGLPAFLLNADADEDLTLERDRSLLVVDGFSGNDILELAGVGTGVTYDGDAVINGGPDDDVLIGGDGNDTITGGTGFDVFQGYGGIDTINAADGVPGEPISSGPGNDAITMDTDDSLTD
jgi:hypothetical protein